jgi:predicted RNase H-like HicB family nuclease
MLSCPVELSREGNFALIQFPDVPEAHAFGISVKDAIEVAADCLETIVEFYSKSGRAFPTPSAPEPIERAALAIVSSEKTQDSICEGFTS